MYEWQLLGFDSPKSRVTDITQLPTNYTPWLSTKMTGCDIITVVGGVSIQLVKNNILI